MVVDRGAWNKLKSLDGPDKKPNVSYHVREAIKLYLKVLETQGEIFDKLKSEASEESTCI